MALASAGAPPYVSLYYSIVRASRYLKEYYRPGEFVNLFSRGPWDALLACKSAPTLIYGMRNKIDWTICAREERNGLGSVQDECSFSFLCIISAFRCILGV